MAMIKPTKLYFKVYSRKFAYEESGAYYLLLHRWKMVLNQMTSLWQWRH